MNLMTNVKVDQVLGYFAAAQTVRKSDIVDMTGFEGCMFVYEFCTILDTGVIACDINGNTTNATGGSKLAGGASATIDATTAALTQSAIVVDIYQPEPSLHRYLEAMITPTVANAVITGITAIRYNGKLKPEDVSDLLASSLAVSPAVA